MDAEDNVTPLAGATFELRDVSGTTIKRGTTGSDGTLEFNDLEAGTYTVVEVTPPANYLPNE